MSFPPKQNLQISLPSQKLSSSGKKIIISPPGKCDPKFPMVECNINLLSFQIQVLKMVKICMGCSKIQLTWGRNKIFDMHTLCRINKHFTLKCLPFGGGGWHFQQLGEEKFWLGIGIYRFCLGGNWSWMTLWSFLKRSKLDV